MKKPIYALCCNLHQNRGESWYRVTILRGPDCECSISDLSISLGRRLLDRLADRYGVADRAGLFAGSLVPFDVDQE